MEIVYKDPKTLIAYEKNPRKNDAAVKFVAKSIKEFGFKIPVIIDKNDVIVAGHTRQKASLKLEMNSIPCIVADDLSENQIRAFRLADNKVAEKAEWDFNLLDEEIEAIDDLDMGDFGFEFEEAEVPVEKPKKNERVRTDDAYNLPYVDLDRCDGKYQIPIIERESHVPDSLIGFNYALTAKDKTAGVHFYIDDYQFERIWVSPEKYIEVLKEFDCVLTPDFSLYMDMPLAMKLWNVFRSRLIGQMMQDAGITVIPTVSWAEPATFDFCFDGIEAESIVSISTVGVKNSTEAMSVWKAGVSELIARKKPKAILVYGGEIDFDYGNRHVLYFANTVTERMKDGR